MTSSMLKFRWFVAFLICLSFAPDCVVAQEDVQEQEERALKAAMAKVSPSVVRIETFGGLEKVGRLLVGTGPTTGLVVGEDGYVLSSAFNFVQKPASILVTFSSGKRASAEIVARDQSRMLVLLKVNTEEKFVVPEVVPRSDLVVGQWTVAIGKTFSGNQPSMSVGILSATHRIWGKAVQSDCKISPSNYGGPLVDIRGRVIGVLVPMSPQGQGEVAGAEWYDSGIGFAVPLEDINRHLEKLKRGEDLKPGLLGISLKGTDIYSSSAKIAAVSAKSPAAEAGLKAGDTIVEVDGMKIVRQAQLKHALGSKYAGDTVAVAVLRSEQRIEAKIELTDKIVPYEHPFLGVLPKRGVAGAGAVVRYVYPDSPASKAGLMVDDRIMSIAGAPIADAHAMQDLIASCEPKSPVKLKIDRGGEEVNVDVELATLPTAIPEALPPAQEAKPAGDDPAGGIVEIKIPEEKNKCIAYVPQTYRADVAHGLVVWLHAPGGFDQDKLIADWKAHCERDNLVLLAPQAADPKRWQATETEFIGKTIDEVLNNYNIDRTRVVTHGYQAGGAMAYLVAFRQTELIRGVAAVDSGLPRSARPPANDPIKRLAIYTTTAAGSKLKAAIQTGVTSLKNAKFPVTVKDLGAQARYLNAEEIEELARWIDTLDRI